MMVYAVVSTLFLQASVMAAAQQKIPPVQLAPAGDTGRRITEEGLLANYYPAQRKAPAPQFDATKGVTMGDHMAASLKTWSQHPEAVIPLERIAGRIFLVCGEQDQIWPSCPMARLIDQRLREHRRPAAILLAYENAGHTAFGTPVPADDPRLATAGGTPQGALAARADSWSRVTAFLKTSLRQRP